jgi:molecular chaperone DnaK
MMNNVIIGIDLGTTNSEVAVVRNGKVVVIEENHSHLLPSVVALGEQGDILVGETARNQYALYPERTVKSIKRHMGEDVVITLAEQSFTPQEISALILKRLKAIAQQYLGHAVHQAVITVPAYFSDAQRQATREAGEIAGLEVVRMINEPTAAALAYEANRHAHKKIMVYDLGGGTFDVSIVGIEDDVVEVLASHGNNHLGGDDFDGKIVAHLVARLKQEHGDELVLSGQVMARIDRAAEAAKKALSDQPFVRIEEEYLMEHAGAPIHLSLELARLDYEKMIADYIDETLDAVHVALRSAQLTVADIEEILLVGGSTRTPFINDRLLQLFDLEPLKGIDPDLCVATGAALQAGIIAGEAIDSVLVDITPYTFGTSAVGDIDGEMTMDMFVPVIHKNSPLPTRKTEAFFTMCDGQEKVNVTIFQGEAPHAGDNIEIGQFMVEGLGDVPSGNVINLTLSLDLSGVLHVFAQEKATGLEKSITINNALSHMDDAALETAKERIDLLFGEDDVEHGASGAGDDAIKTLLARASVALEQANDDDRVDIIDLVERINDALAANNQAALTEPVEQLNDILYYLED